MDRTIDRCCCTDEIDSLRATSIPIAVLSSPAIVELGRLEGLRVAADTLQAASYVTI